jgi:hypothetical protein
MTTQHGDFWLSDIQRKNPRVHCAILNGTAWASNWQSSYTKGYDIDHVDQYIVTKQNIP